MMHHGTRCVFFVYTGHGERGVYHLGQEEIRAGGVARRRTQVGPDACTFDFCEHFCMCFRTYPSRVFECLYAGK